MFIPSTLLILGLTYFFYRESWKKYLGIDFEWSELAGAATLCLVFFFTARFMIQWALPKEYALDLTQGWGYLTIITNLFQSLNEEMVFRGLLINAMLYLGFREWKIIFLPAIVFSLLHWVFYKFNLSHDNGGTLSFSALTTLFLFGAATSMLFLKTRNILIPWALHSAWNFNRFSMIKVDDPQGYINEALTFNILEGTFSVVFMTSILFVACYLTYKSSGR